jgi:hypothetical protein
LAGWDIDQLHAHLEVLFTDGMTFDNYGEWEIDHIIPLVSFDFEGGGDEAIRKAWALSNIQPLWKYDNRSKGARAA